MVCNDFLPAARSLALRWTARVTAFDSLDVHVFPHKAAKKLLVSGICEQVEDGLLLKRGIAVGEMKEHKLISQAQARLRSADCI